MMRALLLLLALGGAAQPIAAQTGVEIRGMVRDESGGLIVGASVAVTPDGGARSSTTTDREGYYRLRVDGPGKMTLTIEASGFAPATRLVSVTNAGTTSVDITLRVAIDERVDVRGGLVGVSLDSDQNLSGIRLSGKALEALPDDPETLLQALRMLAATTGTRPDLVSFYVDGLPLTQRVPAKDVIQSVRINANPFSPEFAEPGTSRVEILTKPASEHYHGNGRIDFNDARMNSSNPFEPNKASYQTRTYEGYIGGPIVRNRWGFLAYGGRWDQDDNMVVNATPVDPATLQPQSLRLNVAVPTRTNAYSLKTDARITQYHTAAVEYGLNEQDRENAGLQSGFDLPERAYSGQSREATVSLWITSALPTILNEFRARVSRNRLLDQAVTTSPAVLVLEAFNSGGNQDALYRTDTTERLRVSNVTTLAGTTHSFRFGGQADVLGLEQADRANFNGTFIFGSDVIRDRAGNPVLTNGEPSVISSLDLYRFVLSGTPGYHPSQFSIVNGDAAVQLSIGEAAVFAQDDWRAAPRLTISYGARYQMQQHDGVRMRLAPRAGLAWAPSSDGNSAIRAGVGVFYTQIPPRLFTDAARLDGRHGRQFVVDQPAFFPTVPASALPGVQNASATVRTMSPELGVPMTVVSTVSYDRRLVGDIFGSVGYTWRHGSDLLRTRNLGVSSVPGVANALVMQFESTGRSRSHEVNTTISGSIGANVTMYGSYGFTRAMQDTDDLYSVPADSSNLAAEWGVAPLPRHRISIGGSINLPDDYAIYPFFNWTSALPFNITSGNDTNRDSVFTDRPSLADAGQPGVVETAFGVFNPNPAPGDAVVARNFGIGPTYFTFDVTAAKMFAAYQGAAPSSHRATLLVSVTNLLNRNNYAPFNGVVTSPFFGTANRVLNNRRVTLSLRYDF